MLSSILVTGAEEEPNILPHLLPKFFMVVVTTARTNSNVNEQQDRSYWDYENYEIVTGDIERYRVYQRIGKGKYSEVFEGRRNKEKMVIKVLKPVRATKINREILILRNLSHKNIIRLLDVVMDPDSQTFSLIFEYIEHEECINMFGRFTYEDTVEYCRQMLSALKYCHSMGIMHRDIKPQNMIINEARRELKLIDWGLAEFYHPGQEYSVRVASRYYKGPELLVNYPYYDYSLDIWSFGCVLAEIVFKKRPFFHGESNNDQFVKIARVLGYTDLKRYISKYDMGLPKYCEGVGERISLHSFASPDRNALYGEAIDLLERIFVYDHQDRPTAEECLDHPFFKHAK